MWRRRTPAAGPEERGPRLGRAMRRPVQPRGVRRRWLDCGGSSPRERQRAPAPERQGKPSVRGVSPRSDEGATRKSSPATTGRPPAPRRKRPPPRRAPGQPRSRVQGRLRWSRNPRAPVLPSSQPLGPALPRGQPVGTPPCRESRRRAATPAEKSAFGRRCWREVSRWSATAAENPAVRASALPGTSARGAALPRSRSQVRQLCRESRRRGATAEKPVAGPSAPSKSQPSGCTAPRSQTSGATTAEKPAVGAPRLPRMQPWGVSAAEKPQRGASALPRTSARGAGAAENRQ